MIGWKIAVVAALLPYASAAQESTLTVVRASDPAPSAFPVDKKLPEAAFAIPATIPLLNDRLEIVGVETVDVSNRPGRIDERDRIFHTGAEPQFAEKMAAFAAVTPPVLPTLRPDWMLAHFIDVGQGNATLLEFSCGAVLVDTGGQKTATFDSTARLASYLNDFFARRTDLQKSLAMVLLTHPHADHTAGSLGLIKPEYGFKIGSVVANARTDGSGKTGQAKLIAAARARGVPVSLITNESIRRSDGLTSTAIDPLSCATVNPDIRVLWGSDSGTHRWAAEGNNHSVVARVDFGESSFLFTGDMEEDAQPEFISSYVRNPDIIDADVYQVGHHGSKNGTTAALLKVMTPEIAVIGAGNPADEEPNFSAYMFGHPNRVAVELLSSADFGVTKTRPKVSVAVGINGRNPRTGAPPRYSMQELSKAIFSTGWDGDIIIAASATGQKIVQIE